MQSLVSLAQTLVRGKQKLRNDQLKEKYFQTVQQTEGSMGEMRLRIQTLEMENRQLREQMQRMGVGIVVTAVDARVMTGDAEGVTGERRANSRMERTTPVYGGSPVRSRRSATPDHPSNRRESEDASDHISEHVESSIQDFGESVASEESAKV